MPRTPPARSLRSHVVVMLLVSATATATAGCGGEAAPEQGARTDRSPVVAEVPGQAAEPNPGAAARSDAARSDAVRSAAVEVLRSWDRARAAAYAGGDVRALRGLYLPGSRAGRADLRVLRAYRRHGLRVEGMRTQLLTVEVHAERRRWMRLRVVDRLTGAQAVHVETGRRTALPRDAPTQRLLELHEVGGRWVVGSVEE